MKTCVRLMLCVVLVACVAGAKGDKKNKANKPKREAAEATVSETKLPDKVRATFVGKFPNAAISKADSEKEEGVMVWDIEFRDGKTQKETDIAEDGTMLEYTVYITKKTMPKPVMKRIEKAASEASGAMGRMERIEISYETKDGKVVKLDKPKTHYSVEITKEGQIAEIVVDENGKVVEAPKWEKKAEEKKSAA